MDYCETAVEMEREVEKFNEARTVNRFMILCIWYHLNYCKKSPCSNCKFIKDFKDYFLSNFNQKSSSEIIFYFQNHCRQNYNEFYVLFKLSKSIAAIKKHKIQLEIKLRNIIQNGM